MRIVKGLLAGFLLLNVGCAQFMAANQPRNVKAEEVLTPGGKRSVVINELGAPATTDTGIEERLTDVYKYKDGQTVNAWAGKVGRILVYTAGDIFTLCLSQVIWLPIEIAISGREYTAEVDYEREPENGKWAVSAWGVTNHKGKLVAPFMNASLDQQPADGPLGESDDGDTSHVGSGPPEQAEPL